MSNEIKALSGRKFIGDELTTYGDELGRKKEGMIRISGFNTNSIQLDKIRSTYRESIDVLSRSMSRYNKYHHRTMISNRHKEE